MSKTASPSSSAPMCGPASAQVPIPCAPDWCGIHPAPVPLGPWTPLPCIFAPCGPNAQCVLAPRVGDRPPGLLASRVPMPCVPAP
eukprot:scaffold52524_cov21-Tisochrysis_lutea.AAC.2